MNRDIFNRSVEALASLSKYGQWQIKEGGSFHPTLPSAVDQAAGVLVDARKKSTTTQEIDSEKYEVEPCKWCGDAPQFVERPGNAFGFKCTCGGKRYIQTYYDSSIPDRSGRIASAVASWNGYPVNLQEVND
jgi:hypothetical protein